MNTNESAGSSSVKRQEIQKNRHQKKCPQTHLQRGFISTTSASFAWQITHLSFCCLKCPFFYFCGVVVAGFHLRGSGLYTVCVCVWAAVCTLPPLSPAPRMSAHSERVPNRTLLHYRAHYRVRQSAMAREQMQGCSHGVCSAGPCGLGRSPRNVVGGGWCRNGVSPGAIGYPRLQCVFKYKSMKEIP